jgi:sugar phosphate permease
MFLIFGLQYLLLFFHRVCPAVLAPELIKTFGTSGTALGLLSSAYFYPYALMQIPIGMLADQWGARKTATVFGGVAAAGAVVFGLSPGFGTAVFGRVLIGLGVSAIFVPAMKVYAEWFKPGEYGRVAGLFVGVGGVGWLMGAAPLAFLLERFDWRTIFIAIGAFSALLTVVTWLAVTDTPEQKGFSPQSLRPLHSAASRRSPDAAIRSVLSEKYFWPLACWFFLRTGIIFCFFGLWAGPYLMHVHGLSKVAAGTILSVFPLALIVGSPFLGYLSDQVLASRKKVIVGTSVIHAACWLVLVLYCDTASALLLCVLFVLMGVAAGSPGNIGFAAVKEIFPVNIAGTSVGAVNLFAFASGIFFQPLTGYVLDITGALNGKYPPAAYKTVFVIFLSLSLLALLGGLLSKETNVRASVQ